MKISDLVFVVVDLETTGGSRQNDEITEIGAVMMWRDKIYGEFKSFVNPHRPIPQFIQDLTGITDAMVADAPPLDRVLAEFTGWAEESVLVAHPAAFDLQFLRVGYQRHQIPWRTRTPVCTLKLARRCLPKTVVADHKLPTLAAHYGVAAGDSHRALDDARATAGVLSKLIAETGAQELADISCDF